MAPKRSGRPKSGRKRGRPQGRTPSVTVFARIDPQLGRALDAYVEATRPKTSQTAVVELALEEYLTRHGFWPLKPAEEGTPPPSP